MVIDSGMEVLTDMNVLYDAFQTALKGSSWKQEPQRFEYNWLHELNLLRTELLTKSYITSKGSEFNINERGKVRHIHGNIMRDRVVRHALCDYILEPCLDPYLISNNFASRKNKGLSYARHQFEKDLHNYYLETGSNDGYLILLDMSKFFDNIRHDLALEMLYKYIPSDVHWLLKEVFRTFEVNVSSLSEIQYYNCINEKFDSVAWYNENRNKTASGLKYLKKSVNIGDQVSQYIGVFYPHIVDDYAKIVLSLKYYGRYMDDIYCIVNTKEKAESLIEVLMAKIKSLSLFINMNKLKIIPLCGSFKYLQVTYHLTPTGKVVKKISKKSLKRERHKLLAYKRLLLKDIIYYDVIEQAFRSWFGSNYKLMSKEQRFGMQDFYYSLFSRKVGWKSSFC